MRRLSIVLLVGGLLLSAAVSCTEEGSDMTVNERSEIEEVIKASIGWALTKDWDLLYGSLAQDANFFIYHPDAASTIVGFDAFKTHAERLFKTDDFKATHFEVKELRVTQSQSGAVAWYSCLLDDYYEWQGTPGGWENCRWTGVLEKREDRWVIVQMHFSFPTGGGENSESESDTP